MQGARGLGRRAGTGRLPCACSVCNGALHPGHAAPHHMVTRAPAANVNATKVGDRWANARMHMTCRAPCMHAPCMAPRAAERVQRACAPAPLPADPHPMDTSARPPSGCLRCQGAPRANCARASRTPLRTPPHTHTVSPQRCKHTHTHTRTLHRACT
jgi:hypothetical protein